MYGNYVFINSTIVERAIREKNMLEIIIPNGRATVDPQKWKANGRVMKKVFKYPDNPMILYGGEVPIQMEKTKGVITTLGPDKKNEN